MNDAIEEDLLHRLVAALDDDDPDEGRAERDAGPDRDSEEREAARDTGEFGDHIAEVGQNQTDHEEKGDAEAKLFADQIAEALAGDGSHAGSHLLHHDEGQSHGDHDPEQSVAELGPGLGVGPDAAGVVVDVGGDEARANHGQEHHETDSPQLHLRHSTQPVWTGIYIGSVSINCMTAEAQGGEGGNVVICRNKIR